MPRSSRRSTVMRHRKKMSPSEMEVQLSQGVCPEGHVLPHKTVNGSCTPIYCAGGSQKDTSKMTFTAIGKAGRKKREEQNRVLALISQEADKVIDALIPETIPGWQQARAAAKEQKGEELLRLAKGIGRHAAMKAYFNVPEGLTGADAEAWIQKRSVELSVDALAEFERQLKLGDDTQRREAARDILRMNGMDRKEAPPQSNAVIVLNNPVGLAGIPWLKPVQQPAAAEVVSGAASTKELPANAEKHS